MIDYSRYAALKVEKKNRVAVLTLNRSDTLNAVDPTLLDELSAGLQDLAKDDEVNTIVITGAGRAFSAGGDIAWMERRVTDPSAPGFSMEDTRRFYSKILQIEKPIIGAINGDAVGAGAGIAFVCDIIISSENARFGDTHVKLGLLPGPAIIIWPFMTGINRAKEYLMTGNLIPAREAERIGFVNQVVSPEQLMPVAIALAEKLARGAPRAIRNTKMCLNQPLRDAMNAIPDSTLYLAEQCLGTRDHREALRAFLEKRRPDFKGS